MPSDIVFLDTETLGIPVAAPAWEFAAIRRTYTAMGWTEREFHCFISHRKNPWLGQLPDKFKADYLERYDAEAALTRCEAARVIYEATKGAHIVGAVPSFDTPRLENLLVRHGFKPSWHYHLLDVETLAVGWLAGRGELVRPPWKSDKLSAAIGVDPGDFNRHTAMGDVKWIRAQWDTVIRYG